MNSTLGSKAGRLIQTLTGIALALLSGLAHAHAGHGVPGTFSHDFQHQLWQCGALVVIAALLLAAGRRKE